MKTVLLVNIAPVYISNETGYPVALTDKEKLLNMFSSQYTFVEIYTPLAKFSGKTYKALDEQISKFSSDNKIFDFESIIIKK